MGKFWALALFSISLLFFLPSQVSGYTYPETEISNNHLEYINFAGPITALDRNQYLQIADCSDFATLCIDIALNDVSNYQILEDGAPYASGIAGCDFDTLKVYNYRDLPGQGTTGPFVLQQWVVNGMTYSTNFNTIAELVDSMNVWDPTGNWRFISTNTLIFGGDQNSTYSGLTIYSAADAMTRIFDHVPFIDPQGTQLRFSSGQHQVVLIDNISGEFDTLDVWVGCVTSQTINTTLTFRDLDTICLTFDEFAVGVDTVFNACPSTNGVAAYQLLPGDSCWQVLATAPGTDAACFVACDSVGICDTTFFNLIVESATGNRNYYDTVFVAERGLLCLDQSVFAGSIDTIYNDCNEESASGFANFTIDEAGYCIDYTGVQAGGTVQGCFVMCDDTDDCDTTRIFITVLRMGPVWFNDSVFVNTDKTFCDWDTANLMTSLDSIYNFCPGQSGTYVSFDIDPLTNCVSFTGLAAGIDTACFVLVDTDGNRDTNYLVVNTMEPETDTIIDNIRLGLTVPYCLDTDEIGPDLMDTIYVCDEMEGGVFTYTLDHQNLCVDIEGAFPGSDTLCVFICNEFDVCDTTRLFITVNPIPGTGPTVFDDVDTLNANDRTVLNVLENDSIGRLIQGQFQFYILDVTQGGSGPMNGVALINTDGTIEYRPNTDFCGTDQFDYVFCDNIGCDTARVTLTITCPSTELKFFSGFSPNGDGANDDFVIEGLDNYPDHTLFIYNRWGNLLLETDNYQNNWQGTWKDTDLPDGIYFYLFETGTGEKISGHVTIRR